MPKIGKNGAVYSVKLEVDGTTRIFTLRVGKSFTELSLARDGRLVEILREEEGEATHEKF